MCLTIKSGPHKARKDKAVFKVLELHGRELRSPYQETPYVLGRELLSPFTMIDSITVERGLHACTSLLAAKQHQFYGCHWRVFRARIPAGATYYLGTDGEIVSDRLIVDKAPPVAQEEE